MTIPNNRVRSRNTIEQAEHEDRADARRVVLTDPVGDFIGPANGLPVYIVDAGANGNVVKTVFEEISSVAVGATELLLAHTVLPGTESILLKIEVSGTNIATYDLYINGTINARKRTYFSGDFVTSFDFGTTLSTALKLVEGDQLEVRVTNFRPYLGDFEARFQYIQSPL